jgi:folate-binding protein YgfZ
MQKTYAYFSKPAAWFKVYGEDTAEFLQGQFSNDLGQMVVGSSVYGLWLNHKGKVLADSSVLKTEEEVYQLFSYFSDPIILKQRLENYIIADDVEVLDQTEAMASVSLWGENVEIVLKDLELEIPNAESFSKLEDGVALMSRRSSQLGVDLIVEKEAIPRLKERIKGMEASGLLAIADEGEAMRERIMSGIPAVPWDLGAGDLPQEGGLGESAVSYTKGCYLGQEVMARLRLMGKVRRTLVQIRSSESIASPCDLTVGDKVVGELRSFAWNEPNGIGFAMVSTHKLGDASELSIEAGGLTIVTLLKEGF